MSAKTETLIIGAGITGLAMAVFLREKGHSVTVVEKNSQPGGWISSQAKKGYWLEYGPNTFMFSDRGPDRRLVQMAGAEKELVLARPAAAKRYIALNGKLTKISPNLPSLIKEGILDWKTVGKIGSEVFRRSTLPEFPTVREFFAQRLGATAVDNLVGPFVSGIYAGDPDQLSAAHAFPRLFNAYRDKQSLIRGIFAMPKTGDGRPASYWMQGGLGTLAEYIARQLGDDLVLETKVKLTLTNQSLEAEINGKQKQFDKIIITAPLAQTLKLLEPATGSELPAASSVPYGSIGLIHLGFKEDLPQLDGFGFLVSLREKTPLLGALYNSSAFPERTPNGGTVVTLFCGGLLRKEWLDRSDEELKQAALDSFRHFTGIKEEPDLFELTRVPDAIPQFPVSHDKTLRQITQLETDNPGLHIVANWIGGISVPDRIRAAFSLSEKL